MRQQGLQGMAGSQICDQNFTLSTPAKAHVLSFSKHKVQKFEYSDKFRMGKTF